MTEAVPVPSRPGIYEDAVGALISVHFDDGSQPRLMAAPLVEARSVPLESAASTRGPYTFLLPLTELDRRRIIASLRFCARLGGQHRDDRDAAAAALLALAARVEAAAS